MGVWDALGRGVQAGVDAFLAGKLRQDEQAREAAMQKLREEQLALQRWQAQQEMDRYQGEMAQEERLRTEARWKELDPRSAEPGIHIPMYRIFPEGYALPTSQAERDRMYAEQKAAWEEKQRALREEEYGYQAQLEELRAQLRQPEGAEPKRSFFTPEGMVDPEGAFAFYVDWIQFRNGDPATDPVLRELFLDDVARATGVPQAREKALAWLLRNTPQPRGDGGGGFGIRDWNIWDRLPFPFGSRPERSLAPRQLVERGVEKGKEVFGDVRGALQGAAQAQQSAAPVAPPITPPPAGVPAQPQKTVADFEAEIRAQRPELVGMPMGQIAIRNLAQRAYNEYINSLR